MALAVYAAIFRQPGSEEAYWDYCLVPDNLSAEEQEQEVDDWLADRLADKNTPAGLYVEYIADYGSNAESMHRDFNDMRNLYTAFIRR